MFVLEIFFLFIVVINEVFFKLVIMGINIVVLVVFFEI